MDGYIRDVKKIIELGFPVFSSGIRPIDSKGRACVVSYDCQIKCGGVFIRSGNLIVADYNGVVVVPQEVKSDVLEQVYQKMKNESASTKELKNGKYLRDVYNKYGVL